MRKFLGRNPFLNQVHSDMRSYEKNTIHKRPGRNPFLNQVHSDSMKSII